MLTNGYTEIIHTNSSEQLQLEWLVYKQKTYTLAVKKLSPERVISYDQVKKHCQQTVSNTNQLVF